MKIFIIIRIFCAVFLSVFGIGLVFVRPTDPQFLIGAVLASIGLTFLIQVLLAAKRSY